jgi:2-phosphoglycerate kinase
MAAHNVVLHVMYGIPCVGKSTTAVALAYHRDIRTVIHTDYVREVQRGFVSAEQAPALARVTHDAWKLYGPPTAANIVAGFVDHVEEVAVGIDIVVKKLVRDGLDAVLEGAHFHGRIIDNLRAANPDADVKATLLIVRTIDELHQRIDDKQRRRAQVADDKQWRENSQVMLMIQDYLVSDAHAHGIPIVATDEGRNSWNPAKSPYSTWTMP